MKLLILFSVFSVIFAVGQWKEISVDSEEASKTANLAAKALSFRLNSPYHAKLAHLHKVEKQVIFVHCRKMK